MSDQRVEVLALLAESTSGCTAWDIAARLGKVSSSGTTKSLKMMQRAGWVVGVRRAGPRSRPVWTMTEDGRQVFDRTRTRRAIHAAGETLEAVVHGYVAGRAASFVLPKDAAALSDWVAACRARVGVGDQAVFDACHAIVNEYLRHAPDANAWGMYPAITWSQTHAPVTVSYYQFPHPTTKASR
ncbi:MarR family winged helix-turn-helix transcriptional regulator [Nocardia terpenica]|uniref:Uncharacterized protein n=1 Tax=Nocardia terpenica TaxID=455432 RepID=A0A6G9Z890_9NOCA|nr:MarR family winged helix-turn-helix transcriptional regulator [Nocardia terpenica]QIS21386.1 hypothetical protein F6W96_26665 [Nocardia terpenica]